MLWHYTTFSKTSTDVRLCIVTPCAAKNEGNDDDDDGTLAPSTTSVYNARLFTHHSLLSYLPGVDDFLPKFLTRSISFSTAADAAEERPGETSSVSTATRARPSASDSISRERKFVSPTMRTRTTKTTSSVFLDDESSAWRASKRRRRSRKEISRRIDRGEGSRTRTSGLRSSSKDARRTAKDRKFSYTLS